MEGERIAVLYAGSEAARLIARKLRALKVLATVEDAAAQRPDALLGDVRGIVLAGNIAQAGAAEAACRFALASGLPILAIGGISLALLSAMGGRGAGVRAAGGTSEVRFLPCSLFEDMPPSERYFESAQDLALPEGAQRIATGGDGWIAAFCDEEKKIYGLQFDIENNDPDGLQILKNFAKNACGCAFDWTMPAFLDDCVEKLRAACPEGEVVAAVSGGMLSAVAAKLALTAFGPRVRCVLCETGLFRKGEAQRAQKLLSEQLETDVRVLNVASEVSRALAGVQDKKTKCERVRTVLLRALSGDGRAVVRGAGRQGAFALVPLSALLREEARELGGLMGLSPALLGAQPFPETGLAARVRGEATPERLALLREADEAFRQEVEAAGLEKKLWQYYATLETAEEEGDRAVLHALVSSGTLTGYAFRLPYDVIERTVMRVLKEQKCVSEVLYDVTGR